MVPFSYRIGSFVALEQEFTILFGKPVITDVFEKVQAEGVGFIRQRFITCMIRVLMILIAIFIDILNRWGLRNMTIDLYILSKIHRIPNLHCDNLIFKFWCLSS